MKIINMVLWKYAVVETTLGDFKVWENGTMERWNDDLVEFAWFDSDKFNAADLDAIRDAGIVWIKHAK
jgi:hypothetical protein